MDATVKGIGRFHREMLEQLADSQAALLRRALEEMRKQTRQCKKGNPNGQD